MAVGTRPDPVLAPVRLLTMVAVAGLLGGIPAPASAHEGDESGEGSGVGIGPLLEWSFNDRGFSLGWESVWRFHGGGTDDPPLQLAAGGSYRLGRSRAPSGPRFHYLALESWPYVGLSLGAALDARLMPRLVIGAWVGSPLPSMKRVVRSPPPYTDADGGLRFHRHGEMIWVFSIAVGVRSFGFGLDSDLDSEVRVFIAPKLWRMRSFTDRPDTSFGIGLH